MNVVCDPYHSFLKHAECGVCKIINVVYNLLNVVCVVLVSAGVKHDDFLQIKFHTSLYLSIACTWCMLLRVYLFLPKNIGQYIPVLKNH